MYQFAVQLAYTFQDKAAEVHLAVGNGQFGAGNDLAAIQQQIQIYRTRGPLGGALTSQGQNLLDDPAQARAVIMIGLGFIYRFERKGDNVKHYPFGLSVSFESRFYVPWDDKFLRYTVGAVLTFYFVFTGGLPYREPARRLLVRL